jgi:hypothetical protein
MSEAAHTADNGVELKACPFCGGMADYANTWTPSFWIECQECGAEVSDGDGLFGDTDKPWSYSANPQGPHEASLDGLPENYQASARAAAERWNTRPSVSGDTEKVWAGWNAQEGNLYVDAPSPSTGALVEALKKIKDFAEAEGRLYGDVGNGAANSFFSIAGQIDAALQSAPVLAGEDGVRDAIINECLQQQPCTAENPNEDAYQRGKFDGVMEFAKNILALKSPAPQAGRSKT